MLIAMLAGCGSTTEGTDIEVARSSLARNTSPNVSPQERSARAASNVELALDLLRKAPTDDNHVFSPHSISTALAMASAGANGATLEEIRTVLRLGANEARAHEELNALDLALESRGSRPLPEGQGGEPLQLSIVNQIFAQRDFEIGAPFLDTLAVNYGGDVRLLDFIADPEAARGAMNTFVGDATRDKIPELFKQGTVTTDTTVVLVNAVYFKGSWQTPFQESATAPAAFATSRGSVNVPFLNGFQQTQYVEGAGYRGVELPYAGGEASLVVVVPDDLDAFIASLDGAKLAAIHSGLHERGVTISIPKWTTRSPLSLKSTLAELGMPTAFSGSADFSGIADDLFISDVVHEAFIDVNERGTEAAAATGVLFGRVSAPEPATLRADKPFLYWIRDRETNAVLFLGTVRRP